MKRAGLILILLIVTLISCRHDKVYPDYKTEYVIIVVIDGARYSETWGEPSHSFIPNQSELRNQGIIFSDFANDGNTYTISGHTALTTGVYQSINNNGNELPNNPSIFQTYLKERSKNNTKAWVIASKGKLEILANTSNSTWNNKYMPSTNCGIGGAGVLGGYRDDSTTMVRCFEIFDEHHPNLALINFREPDYSAHQSNWFNYLAGIVKTDEYVQQIWDYIENDPIYKGKTTLLVTNDHGRHLNGISSGYSSHGDNCSGCTHLGFLALGPDFKKNKTITGHYNQTDISATVAELLHFNLNHGKGRVITELF
jgi:hypothetical protein